MRRVSKYSKTPVHCTSLRRKRVSEIWIARVYYRLSDGKGMPLDYFCTSNSSAVSSFFKERDKVAHVSEHHIMSSLWDGWILHNSVKK